MSTVVENTLEFLYYEKRSVCIPIKNMKNKSETGLKVDKTRLLIFKILQQMTRV